MVMLLRLMIRHDSSSLTEGHDHEGVSTQRLLLPTGYTCPMETNAEFFERCRLPKPLCFLSSVGRCTYSFPTRGRSKTRLFASSWPERVLEPLRSVCRPTHFKMLHPSSAYSHIGTFSFSFLYFILSFLPTTTLQLCPSRLISIYRTTAKVHTETALTKKISTKLCRASLPALAQTGRSIAAPASQDSLASPIMLNTTGLLEQMPARRWNFTCAISGLSRWLDSRRGFAITDPTRSLRRMEEMRAQLHTVPDSPVMVAWSIATTRRSTAPP